MFVVTIDIRRLYTSYPRNISSRQISVESYSCALFRPKWALGKEKEEMHYNFYAFTSLTTIPLRNQSCNKNYGKVLNYSFIPSLLIGRETKKVIQRKTLHSIREYEICLIMLLMDNSIAFRNMNARSQLMWNDSTLSRMCVI